MDITSSYQAASFEAILARFRGPTLFLLFVELPRFCISVRKHLAQTLLRRGTRGLHRRQPHAAFGTQTPVCKNCDHVPHASNDIDAFCCTGLSTYCVLAVQTCADK